LLRDRCATLIHRVSAPQPSQPLATRSADTVAARFKTRLAQGSNTADVRTRVERRHRVARMAEWFYSAWPHPEALNAAVLAFPRKHIIKEVSVEAERLGAPRLRRRARTHCGRGTRSSESCGRTPYQGVRAGCTENGVAS
jgi:hypothetical protein